MAGRQHSLSIDEQEHVVSLFRTGRYTLTSLARVMETSRWTVARILRRNGIVVGQGKTTPGVRKQRARKPLAMPDASRYGHR